MQGISQRDRLSFVASIYPNITGLHSFSISNSLFIPTTVGREVWVFIAITIRVFRLLCYDIGITWRLSEDARFFHFQLLSIFIAQKTNSYLVKLKAKTSVESLKEYVNRHESILQWGLS
jgi:hypothetical protein